MDSRSIFITGAASGIGQAVAQRFSQRGWFVGLADVQQGALNRVYEQIGDDAASCYCLDVTNPTAVENAFDAFATRTQR